MESVSQSSAPPLFVHAARTAQALAQQLSQLSALEAAILINDLSPVELAGLLALEPPVAMPVSFLKPDVLFATLKVRPALVPSRTTRDAYISSVIDYQSRLLRQADLDPALRTLLHTDVHTSPMLSPLFGVDAATIERPKNAPELIAARYDLHAGQLTDNPSFWRQLYIWTSLLPAYLRGPNVDDDLLVSTSPLYYLGAAEWATISIAGGSVLAALTISTGDESYADSDVDLFLRNVPPSQLAATVADLLKAFARAISLVNVVLAEARAEQIDPLLIRTLHTINLWFGDQAPTIQIVLQRYDTLEHLIDAFDLDSVAIGSNGPDPSTPDVAGTVIAAPRAVRMLAWSQQSAGTVENTVHSSAQVFDPEGLRALIEPGGKRSSRRLAKYAQRGVAVVLSPEVFNACQLDDSTLQALIDKAERAAKKAARQKKPWMAISELNGLAYALGAVKLEGEDDEVDIPTKLRRIRRDRRRESRFKLRMIQSYSDDEMDWEDDEDESGSEESEDEFVEYTPAFDPYAIADTMSATYIRLDKQLNSFKQRFVISAHRTRATEAVNDLFELDGGDVEAHDISFLTTACSHFLQYHGAYGDDLPTTVSQNHLGLQGLIKLPETLFQKLTNILTTEVVADLPAEGVLRQIHQDSSGNIYAIVLVTALVAFGGITKELDLVRRAIMQSLDTTLSAGFRVLRIKTRDDKDELTEEEKSTVLASLNDSLRNLELKFDAALAQARNPTILSPFVYGQVDDQTKRFTLSYLRSEPMV